MARRRGHIESGRQRRWRHARSRSRRGGRWRSGPRLDLGAGTGQRFGLPDRGSHPAVGYRPIHICGWRLRRYVVRPSAEGGRVRGASSAGAVQEHPSQSAGEPANRLRPAGRLSQTDLAGRQTSRGRQVQSVRTRLEDVAAQKQDRPGLHGQVPGVSRDGYDAGAGQLGRRSSSDPGRGASVVRRMRRQGRRRHSGRSAQRTSRIDPGRCGQSARRRCCAA